MTARVDPSPFPCPQWLAGGHLQTVYAARVARPPRIAFVRERIRTPDDDFLDLDWAAPGLHAGRLDSGETVFPEPALRHTAARRWWHASDAQALAGSGTNRALLLFHGLEGSSQSHYAQALAHWFRTRGWAIAVVHFRGCSGFANRLARAYYSGDSADVAFAADTVRQRLPGASWHAVGVSLGGNALLRFLGETGQRPPAMAAAAAVSAPVDLVACGQRLSTSLSGRHMYGRHFLRTMKTKMADKARQFPGMIDGARLARAATLHDFDDVYTAPMHGYASAMDYWTRASSKPVLARIALPTLVLNARDDPFVPAACLPAARDASRHVTLHQPLRGGHVGFVTGPFPGTLDWLPSRLERFFDPSVTESVPATRDR